MFGRTAKCPVSEEARDLIEGVMAWFPAVFGADAARSARVVLPTQEFFPDRVDDTEATLEPLLRRVCAIMGVDPERVELELFRDDLYELSNDLSAQGVGVKGDTGGAAGLYKQGDGERRTRIALNVSGMDHPARRDPTPVIATMAHELAHVLLLGEGRLRRDHPNMEPITDRLTVFRGMGIFNANAAVQFQQYASGGMQGFSTNRLGYLSQQAYGYAMAVWADMRGERSPAWAKHLSLNVQHDMKQAAQYRAQTAKAAR